MTESKLFVSSMSRRELARRRPGRAWGRVQLAVMLTLLVAAVAVTAYVAGRGGF